MTPQQRQTLPEQSASQAELIVNSLQRTAYQHTETIDVDRGTYDCDCNGFVSFVLERSAPGHYAMIPKEADQLRPRAFEYFDFFSYLTPQPTGGWHRINFLRDARRGDIIAWRFPKIIAHHDTGHVLIAAETPKEASSGTFSLRVYDSAKEPHFTDTRGTRRSGSLRTEWAPGTINFEVDAKMPAGRRLFSVRGSAINSRVIADCDRTT